MTNPVIEHLKQLTTKKDQDLGIPMDYFLANFVEKSGAINDYIDFVEHNAFYTTLLNPIAAAQGGADILHLKMLRIKNTTLVHGSAILSNGMLIVIFFLEDIKVGIACLTKYPSDVCDFYRLTASLEKPPEFVH